MTNSEAICGLLVASLFVFFTNVAPVMADEWIQLQRGDLVLTDEEFELITEEMLLLDPRMLSGFRVSGNLYGPLWLMAGRFDMTGDGVEEWFVSIAHFSHCGTAGCTMFVMELVDGKFSTIARNGQTWSSVGPDFVVKLRRGDDGKWIFLVTETEVSLPDIAVPN
ncbi:MAG: hypothetical protein HOB82_05690 [Alphaproteobacteria bacterium]|jgi:hypothetical protein|nr:hypothetical protein [Alphaproteobacteria bacterium]